MLYLWAIVAVSLLFSAFFSGVEMAYLSANKLILEIDKKKSKAVNLISEILDKPDKFITTLLIGNNISLVVYGLAFAKILEVPIKKITTNIFEILVIQNIVSTLVVLIFGELLPKTLFRQFSNKALKIFSAPFAFFYVLFYPLTNSIAHFSNILTKKIKNNSSNSRIFSPVDLNELLNKSDDEHPQVLYEMEIIRNTLDFEKIKIRECLVPRNHIIAVKEDTSLEKVKEIIAKTGFSKIPVYKDNIDNILGYIHVQDLFKNPTNIKEILIDMPVVPESFFALKLLNIFLQKKRSMAWVVDEFGGTAGIVTMEDIIEQIVGDIEDEHDSAQCLINKIDDKTYEIAGAIEIEKLNEELNLEIEENEQYNTLSGFIINKLEKFPSVGTKILTDKFDLEITEMSKNVIKKVRLIRKDY